MKKIVVLLCIMVAFVCCSCTVDTSGYSYELTSKSWEANLEGGGRVELVFNDSNATLTLENRDLKKQISGKCIADETSFVIFASDLSYNYKFDYIPSGNTLELTYNNMKIVLNSINE
ncbi:MAG: hypothetical protein J1E85_07435 [Ruminococcus sp.]|nr:hypothetical protein [Ruminococcus sp.]